MNFASINKLKKGIKMAFFGLALFAFFGLLGYRIFVGTAIYGQDAAKDALAHFLAAPEFGNRRVVLLLNEPDNAEIGERLEYFINRQRPVAHPVELFNFLEPPYADRENLSRFRGGAGLAPSERQLKDIMAHPEKYVIWQYGAGQLGSMRYEDEPFWEPNMVWRASYLRAGDVLVVPAGSSVLWWTKARGLRLYAQQAKQKLRKLPGLTVQYRGGIRQPLMQGYLGWEIYEITAIQDAAEQAGQQTPYPVAALLALNEDPDITSSDSSRTLYADHRYPQSGLLLGKGWYALERDDNKMFRWMGETSELVLTYLPAGKCRLRLDIEPILPPGSDPFTLTIQSSRTALSYPLAGRNTISFELHSSGQAVQSVRLEARGGMRQRLNNDPRQLKMRVFHALLEHCEPVAPQK